MLLQFEGFALSNSDDVSNENEVSGVSPGIKIVIDEIKVQFPKVKPI